MATHKIKPSTSFWIIGVIALIWNLLGVMAYLGQAFMPDEIKAALPEEQMNMLTNTPAWVTAAFAIAVWGGFLASMLLLARKKIAKRIFEISLLGIIVQLIYNFFIANGYEIYGATGLIMPVLTVLFGIYLIGHSKRCIRERLLT
jgi:peptidoglycan/LPS O-acetylase OafA/YrhL